ncbi:hypothetical protein AB0B27_30400, partial [Micromonospora rifamycinica]|uniref:MmyB family transcriptional regulator n=1 Tax=Micromonospora rifamycinica TaxID=291594 RepID=UPI00346FABE5
TGRQPAARNARNCSSRSAAGWADHRVTAGGAAGYPMRHPVVGELTVTQQTLRTGDDQLVVVATTAPGSPSQAAMTLLVHAAATGRATTRQPLPTHG